MFKNALVTVSDKTGLAEFIRPLVDKGMRVVSTGGTARYLKSHKIPITEVSEQTTFPEVLSGRVKTLHPFIHMPILARQNVPEDQDTLKKYNLDNFDLVVCNLYPFSQNSHLEDDKELVEWIDVGGPSLLRAAAKNFFKITALCSSEDYKITQNGNTSLEQRKKLAAKIFRHLSHYDMLIANRLDETQSFFLQGEFLKTLRYGENPHQKGEWYKNLSSPIGIHEAQMLQGKELSFNNLLDLEAAVSTLKEFQEACCVCVKHNNPCGVAYGKQGNQVVEEAIKTDPVSVFGGIIATNQKVDASMAKTITEIFVECVIAPDFTEESLEIFSQKKNLRILKWPNFYKTSSPVKWKQITGGILVQDQDQVDKVWNKEKWQIIGQKPSEAIKQDILFAWILCAHLKSNAIATVKNKKTIGLGMGQINRVDAVNLALSRARKFHPTIKSGIILASDAFFPFPDSVEVAAEQGVEWVIQPGGSIKDTEVLQRAQDLGVNVILTGKRHFQH